MRPKSEVALSIRNELPGKVQACGQFCWKCGPPHIKHPLPFTGALPYVVLLTGPHCCGTAATGGWRGVCCRRVSPAGGLVVRPRTLYSTAPPSSFSPPLGCSFTDGGVHGRRLGHHGPLQASRLGGVGFVVLDACPRAAAILFSYIIRVDLHVRRVTARDLKSVRLQRHHGAQAGSGDCHSPKARTSPHGRTRGPIRGGGRDGLRE